MDRFSFCTDTNQQVIRSKTDACKRRCILSHLARASLLRHLFEVRLPVAVILFFPLQSVLFSKHLPADRNFPQLQYQQSVCVFFFLNSASPRWNLLVH